MEKILERKLSSKNSFFQIQAKLDNRLNELSEKFGGEEEVGFTWGPGKKKLLIASRYFNSEINLDSHRLQVWIDVPFLFRLFKGRVVAELTREIEKIIQD